MLYRLLFFTAPAADMVVDWLPRFPHLSPVLSLIALVAGAVILWWLVRLVYFRAEPAYVTQRRKRLLTGLRATGLCLILFMAMGAYLELSRRILSNGVLALLFDCSASMSIAEPRTDTNAVRQAAQWLGLEEDGLTAEQRKRIDTTSRLDLAKAALGQDGAAMLRRLGGRFDLRFFTFGQRPEAIPLDVDLEDPAPLARAGPAEQSASRLGDALRDVGRRLRGQYVAAVVPVTDGGVNQGEDPEAVIPGLGAPLYPVGMGLTDTRDVELKFMMMEDVIFKGDRFPVTLHSRHAGYAGRETEIVVRRDGLPIHTEKLLLTDKPEITHVVELSADRAGSFIFETEITPFPDEITARNNTRRRYDVRVVEEPVRVLVVEDRPRWEWRFLKASLDADKERVRARHLLFAADRRVAQQRPDMLLRFPDRADELRDYNLVIVGDVSPDVFTRKEQILLEEHVRVDGGWLIFLAGRRMPGAWDNTPLSDLLPVEPAGTPVVGGRRGTAALAGVIPVLTEAGRAYPLLRLHADEEESAALWRKIPPLFWFYPARHIKPGAETLMQIPAPDEMVPLIVHQRYGAGQVLYIGTDETWRWRKLPGGEYHRRLWSQIVTQTGLDHVMAGQGIGRVQIETASRELTLGSEAPVIANVLGIDNRPLVAEQIRAVLVAEDGREDKIVLRAEGARRGVFSGSWRPATMGKHRVYVQGLENEGEWAVTVVAPQIEFDQPALRADLLSRLAEKSGGRYIPANELDALDRILADLEPLVRTQRREKPLWNAPGLLVLLAAVFGLEWILRKRWDLL